MTRRNYLTDIEHQNRESERRMRVYATESRLKDLIERLESNSNSKTVSKAKILDEVKTVLHTLTGRDL